jgi:molybdenum cofactor cytidylyltransferase
LNSPAPLTLARALRLSPQVRLGVVGAGGKTSTLFQCGRDLLADSNAQLTTALISVSTHLAYEQIALADQHFFVRDLDELARVEASLPEGLILISGPRSTLQDHPNRVTGLGDACLERLRTIAGERAIPLLIEADGSKRLPLKAPAEYEPALPGFVDHVVVVAGLSGLGRPLGDPWVHRPERFADLSGLSPGELVTPQALARLLAHPDGGLRNIPANARRTVLLNQADTPELQSQAGQIAAAMFPAYDGVVVASVNLSATPASPQSEASQGAHVYAVHEPVAGIVLAAGGSHRYGRVKQLLPWKGQPLVRHAARLALEAGLSPVIVVAGESLPEIQTALEGLDVTLVHNPTWSDGQSTSVRLGLEAIQRRAGAALFLLSDQPRVPSALIKTLVEAHAHSLAPVIAPQVDGQRANPVLFDRITFPAFAELQGDRGGRQLFSRYPVQWLPWYDASVLLDVDTPEDYRRLLDEG